MKTKKLLTQILIVTLFTFILISMQTTTSKAVLQANKNTHYHSTKGRQTLTTWLPAFRNMEASGGAMGLRRNHQ